ncbi:MAG: CHASE3 domain-containing protein, partial [Kordiimonadaceae bacterium]|nr:CHASE3 domain-containing protein [Kordiimonadaceae bacterium]
MFQNLSTRVKINIGFLTPIFFSVILGISVMLAIQSIKEANENVVLLDSYLDNLQKLENSTLDMETGMRGFLLAGREDFLAPYNVGAKNTFDQLAELNKQFATTPEQMPYLEKIETLVTDWQNNVAEPNIELRRAIANASNMNDISILVRGGEGKVLLDEFRTKILTFIDRENTLLNLRRSIADKARSAVDKDFGTV